MEKKNQNKAAKTKSGGKPHTTSKQLVKQVQSILDTHNRASQDLASTVSHDRFKAVSKTVVAFYSDLWGLGITMGDVRNVKQDHLRAWLIHLNMQNRKPATLVEYCKRLLVWFTWLRKPELIGNAREFVTGIPCIQRRRQRLKPNLKKSLIKLLAKHNLVHAKKNKVVSRKTARKREEFYIRFFDDLYNMGYKLPDVYSLKKKHLVEWLLILEEKGMKPGTIQDYVSYLRTLCGWLDKNNMMIEPHEVLKDPVNCQRILVTNEDKTPTNPRARITLREMIDKLEAESSLIADLVRMATVFGLRVEEVLKFKPILNDHGDYIEVRFGTKGGRPRILPIETEAQREALSRLRQYAVSKHGSTIPKELKYFQWENHVRYVFKKVGFVKNVCGYTPYGLRHAYANLEYTKRSGMISRAQGGDLRDINPAMDRAIREDISELLGHSRPQIVNCYLGSNVPKPAKKEIPHRNEP